MVYARFFEEAATNLGPQKSSPVTTCLLWFHRAHMSPILTLIKNNTDQNNVQTLIEKEEKEEEQEIIFCQTNNGRDINTIHAFRHNAY